MPVVDMSRIGLEGIDQANKTKFNDAQVALQQQATEQTRLENDVMQREANADAAIAQSMNDIAMGNGSGSPGRLSGDAQESNSDVLLRTARIAAGIGAGKRSTDLLKLANDSLETENKLQNDEIIRRQNLLENDKLTSNIFAQTMSGATEANWAQTKANLLARPEFTDAQKEQLALLPDEYDADVVEQLQLGSMTAYQRASIDLQAHNAGRSDLIQRNLERQRQISNDLTKQRNEETKRYHDIVAGGRNGKTSAAPTAPQVKTAISVLNSQIGHEGWDKETLGAAAASIAMRTNEAIKRDPSANYEQEMTRVVTEMVASGEISAPKAETPWQLGDDSKPAAFKAVPGKSRDLPAPVPKNDKGQPLEAKLKIGNWYQSPQGPAKYLGEGKWKQ